MQASMLVRGGLCWLCAKRESAPQGVDTIMLGWTRCGISIRAERIGGELTPQAVDTPRTAALPLPVRVDPSGDHLTAPDQRFRAIFRRRVKAPTKSQAFLSTRISLLVTGSIALIM